MCLLVAEGGGCKGNLMAKSTSTTFKVGFILSSSTREKYVEVRVGYMKYKWLSPCDILVTSRLQQ